MQLAEAELDLQQPLPHTMHIVNNDASSGEEQLDVWLVRVVAFTGRRCLQSALANFSLDSGEDNGHSKLVLEPEDFTAAKVLFDIIDGNAPSQLTAAAATEVLATAALYMATTVLPGLGAYLKPLLNKLGDDQVREQHKADCMRADSWRADLANSALGQGCVWCVCGTQQQWHAS